MSRIRISMLVAGLCLLMAVQVQSQTGKPGGVRPVDANRAESRPMEMDSPATRFTLASGGQAIVPRLMKFSGALRDSSGKPLSGSVDVTFALYSTEVGGTPLWFETQSVQADELGRYTALLGVMHTEGLPVDLFTSGEVRWLGIQVGVEAEQQPRVLLVSVPYALKAGDAETLGGKPASAYMLSESQSASTSSATTSSATGTAAVGTERNQKNRTANTSPQTACASITSSGAATANHLSKFTTACNIEASGIVESNGNLGIGTATPLRRLTLVDNVNKVQFELQSSSASTGPNFFLNNIGVTNGGKFLRSIGGTFQVINSAYSAALITIQDGGNVGIGTVVPTAKLEVNGTTKFDQPVTFAAGQTFPGATITGNQIVQGSVNISSPATTGTPPAALSAQATDVSAANYGLYGTSSSSAGTGVLGEADNGILAVGVWGRSTSGLAGLFSGNVQISGSISKASGSFKIDDPLDPANKYLYHSFVESPDMKNIYDGVVTLDGKGEAEVQLPDWFDALNRDFRYQLTCVGGYAPIYVAKKIQDNTFKIAGGTPGLEVDWQVTGIRHDAWANAHRIPVEEAKPAEERGYYLHPELFGAPQQKNILLVNHPDLMKSAR